MRTALPFGRSSSSYLQSYTTNGERERETYRQRDTSAVVYDRPDIIISTFVLPVQSKAAQVKGWDYRRPFDLAQRSMRITNIGLSSIHGLVREALIAFERILKFIFCFGSSKLCFGDNYCNKCHLGAINNQEETSNFSWFDWSTVSVENFLNKMSVKSFVRKLSFKKSKVRINWIIK